MFQFCEVFKSGDISSSGVVFFFCAHLTFFFHIFFSKGFLFVSFAHTRSSSALKFLKQVFLSNSLFSIVRVFSNFLHEFIGSISFHAVKETLYTEPKSFVWSWILKASLSLPGAYLVLVSVVMRTAIRAFCTRHRKVCVWVCMYEWLCIVVQVNTIFSTPTHLGCVLYVKERVWYSKSTSLHTYFIAHYHVNALYLLGLATGKQGGFCSSCQGLRPTGPNVVLFCIGTIHRS